MPTAGVWIITAYYSAIKKDKLPSWNNTDESQNWYAEGQKTDTKD